MTILLVEDEVLIAMSEKLELEKYGYAVRTASNGEKAIEAVHEAADIDLILMDIDLGSGIDGTQAAEIILKDHNLPIVFLSSRTEPEIVQKTQRITSYGYVLKNSSTTVLDASIKMALRLFDAKQAHGRKEDELRASEERFRLAQEMSPDGFTILHPVHSEENEIIDFTILYQNSAVAHINGTESQNVIGKQLLHLFPEHHDTPVFEAYLHVAKTGESRVIEEILVEDIVHKPMWLRLVVVPMGADIAILTQNITDRKWAEEALLEQRNFAVNLVETAQTIILLLDAEGNIVRFNPYTAELLGYSLDAVAGKNWIESFVKLEDRETIKIVLHKTISDDQANRYVNSILTKDGQVILVEWCSKSFRNSEGQVVGILATGVDITERAQLQRNLELRSQILEHIGQAVIATDLQGKVFLWNRTAETMYGIPSEDAIGRSIVELTPTEQTREQAAEIMEELSQGRSWAGEFAVRRRDGSSFPAHVTNTPLFDTSGNLTGIIGISTDITERKRAKDIIQKQLAEKELLLREVHHRIKNNMASIEGLLFLQADSTESTQVKAALQDTGSRVQSMRVLYDKLFIAEDFQEVSIKTYAEELIDSLVTVFDTGKNITVETRISDFVMKAEKVFSLGIILNELLTNVFKYAFGDHDDGRVTVSIDKLENEVALTIKDNGIGYDERALKNTSPGFGLTVVSMLAEQLGGTYSLSNDGGAKSAVRFPL